MSDKAHEATPDHELERQSMSYSEAKNEREWWAMHEIERLRAALKEIAKTDVQTWAKAALEKGDWAHRGYLERIAEYDQQGIACRALAGVPARAALGEGK